MPFGVRRGKHHLSRTIGSSTRPLTLLFRWIRGPRILEVVHRSRVSIIVIALFSVPVLRLLACIQGRQASDGQWPRGPSQCSPEGARCRSRNESACACPRLLYHNRVQVMTRNGGVNVVKSTHESVKVLAPPPGFAEPFRCVCHSCMQRDGRACVCSL